MWNEFIWADHRPRVEFFVDQGLVKRSPSDAQLARATREIWSQGGILERLSHYARHPALLFPTRAKRKVVGQSVHDIVSQGFVPARKATAQAEGPPDAAAPEGDRLDRVLRSLFLFAPARFATQCVFNPHALVPATGMNAPARYVIAHIMQTPHPFPLWDVQVIQPDPGALDELERQIGLTLRGRSVRGRLNRALANRPGYFEFLGELLPRVRRFDYPEVPGGLNPQAQSFVDFLNFAAEM